MSTPTRQADSYGGVPETKASLPSDSPYLSHPFEIDLGEGGGIHSQVVSHMFMDALTELPRPVHSITGEDITGRRDRGTLGLYEPNIALLFGRPEDYGRYSIVRELPYYHLDSYPDFAEESAIHHYLEDHMRHPPEIYRGQEIGDVDVGVFDRKTRTVYPIEVKTNHDDFDAALEAIQKFAAYSDTMGWEVEAEIAVFREEERRIQDLTMTGRIDWYSC